MNKFLHIMLEVYQILVHKLETKLLHNFDAHCVCVCVYLKPRDYV